MLLVAASATCMSSMPAMALWAASALQQCCHPQQMKMMCQQQEAML
jgi:hypothetical protein